MLITSTYELDTMTLMSHATTDTMTKTDYTYKFDSNTKSNTTSQHSTEADQQKGLSPRFFY